MTGKKARNGGSSSHEKGAGMKVRRPRRVLLGIVILVAVGVGLLLWRARRPLDPVPLRIGEDTTRITAPLRADGSVDYLAALNAEGFPPPEPNAAIPLIRALGTQCLVGDPAQVLKLLRAPPDLPEVGSFVEPSEEIESTMPGIRRRSDDPVRPWLEANREALDLIAEASQCEHFRVPIVRDPANGHLTVALPHTLLFDLASALETRSNLAWSDGHAEDAWADRLTLLRLCVVLNEAPDLWTRITVCHLSDMNSWKLEELLGEGGYDELWAMGRDRRASYCLAIAELQPCRCFPAHRRSRSLRALPDPGHGHEGSQCASDYEKATLRSVADR